MGLLSVCLARVAGAAEPAPREDGPGLTTVERPLELVEAAPVPAVRSEGEVASSAHVFDAFRVHADSVRAQRFAGGVSSLVVGGAFIGAGVVSNEVWETEFGTVLIVAGAISVLGGSLAFVFPSEIERAAAHHGVYLTRDPSAEQEAALEREWRTFARKAKSGRVLGAGMGYVLSALALGAGIWVLASDGIDDETRRWLGPTLLVSGGGMAAGATAALIVETPTETAYAAYRASRGKRGAAPSLREATLRVGVAPHRHGGFLGFAAAF